jgi:hypothetical protein
MYHYFSTGTYPLSSLIISVFGKFESIIAEQQQAQRILEFQRDYNGKC